MIKCYFVDVKSISSDLPRSSFDKSELERIADSMLAMDGLLRPLILEHNGVEKYRVIEGHREYYAAVIAKEKNIKQAEMVNAFVIDSEIRAAAIEQLELLTISQRSAPNVDTLVTAISSIVSQQLQPVLFRLDKQEEILSQLYRDPLLEPNPNVKVVEPIIVTPKLEEKAIEVQVTEPKPTKKNPKKTTSYSSTSIEEKPSKKRSSDSTIAKAKTSKKQTSDSLLAEREPVSSRLPDPKATKVKASAPKQIKSSDIPPSIKSETSKITTNTLGSLDPIKETKTLDLINQLTEDMLMLRMKQSGIAKAEQLVPKIIAKRELQPNGKFDSWQQIAAAKISGLGEATIVKIIDKLK